MPLARSTSFRSSRLSRASRRARGAAPGTPRSARSRPRRSAARCASAGRRPRRRRRRRAPRRGSTRPSLSSTNITIGRGCSPWMRCMSSRTSRSGDCMSTMITSGASSAMRARRSSRLAEARDHVVALRVERPLEVARALGLLVHERDAQLLDHPRPACLRSGSELRERVPAGGVRRSVPPRGPRRAARPEREPAACGVGGGGRSRGSLPCGSGGLPCTRTPCSSGRATR